VIAPTDPAAPNGRRRDPLLGTVRIALSFGMLAGIAVSAAALASIPATLIWRNAAIAALSRNVETTLPANFIYAICGVQLLIAVTAMLGYLFVRHLRQVIDSVADGDPFIPDNAVRLNRMGWLVAAIQLIAIPAGALAGWIAWAGHVRYIDVGVSLGGVLLALILFILARVFRRGAEMREELEGTV
jgi:Protein of unknown function (DUF2975)